MGIREEGFDFDEMGREFVVGFAAEGFAARFEFSASGLQNDRCLLPLRGVLQVRAGGVALERLESRLQCKERLNRSLARLRRPRVI